MDYRISDSDGWRTYHLEGRFSHADNEHFSPVLRDLASGGGRAFRMDLSALDYLDSFGIGLFLVARDEARQAGNRLEFGEPRGAVRKLFELAGLSALLAPSSAVPDRPLPRAAHSFLDSLGHRFEVSDLHRDEHGTCRLSLAGRFTFADHDGFQPVIDAIGSVDAETWEIDLKNLEFMDSAALSMLLIARDQARTRGVDLVLRNPRGRVRQLFQLADLPSMMVIREDDP